MTLRERAEVELVANEGKRVGVRMASGPREVLQPHGGLALEGDLARKPSNAAAASNSRPIELVGKVRTPLDQLQAWS